MQLRNSTCQKFERQINNEIATGQQFDYLQVKALKQQIITPEAKRLFGIPAHVPLTMYELAKVSVGCPQQASIYLPIESVRSIWKGIHCAKRIGGTRRRVKTVKYSTVKMAAAAKRCSVIYQFSQSCFSGLCPSGEIRNRFRCAARPMLLEAGVIRNCLVHYGGVIPNEAFRTGLQDSILKFGVANAVGSPLVISDKLVWVYIESSRAFIKACDY